MFHALTNLTDFSALTNLTDRPLTDFLIQVYTTKFSRLAQADLGKGCSTRFRALRALKRSFRKNLPQTYIQSF